MLPSAVLPDPAPAAIYKDQAEALAARIGGRGPLAGADLSWPTARAPSRSS